MPLCLRFSHSWDVLPEEAQRIQNELSQYVCISPFPLTSQTRLTAIAAADEQEEVLAAAVTVDSDNVLASSVGRERSCFPYRSGYLAFHQGPAVLKALSQLNWLGDVIIVSGHGLAHPRRCGFASHLGVLLDLPTIGYARGLLPCNELHPSEHPSVSWVSNAEGVVGIAVYQRPFKNPHILSIGHRVDISTLLTFARLWMHDRSVPEPLRLARHLIREQLRK